MKTYKHKKTGEIATYKDGILKSSGFSVEIGVEPSSNFWEEIVEKDYEILSYIHNGSKHIWKKDSQLKDTFCLEDGKSPFTRLEDILKYPKIYLIHSVKRLSDGEVFTAGDKIKDVELGTCSIRGFKIINKKMHIIYLDYDYPLEKTIKAKQPLFTTTQKEEIIEIIKEFNKK